jgi:hypothetical protein
MGDDADPLVPVARRLVTFLESIGIPVRIGGATEQGSVPGLDVQGGGIVVDPPKLAHPGDLLHEAGHLAVADPSVRGLPRLTPTPGDEMAAIAWSYAAVLHLGLDPAIVFHPDGYRGGSASILENFAAGRTFGVPLLQYYGMTIDPRGGSSRGAGERPYPHMVRWLR